MTATGQKNVATIRHFEVAQSGCVFANAGHFNVEVDTAALTAMVASTSTEYDSVEEFVRHNGRRFCGVANCPFGKAAESGMCGDTSVGLGSKY